MVSPWENADSLGMPHLPHLRREEGQTMAEYGVVLTVVTVLVFGSLMLLSGNLIMALNRVGEMLTP